MAAKKPVKKVAAKAPAKKVSAPAKKAAKKPASRGNGGTGREDSLRRAETLTNEEMYEYMEEQREKMKKLRPQQYIKGARSSARATGGSSPAQRGGNLGSFLRGGGLRRGGR